MPTHSPLRLSIPVSPFPHRASTAPGWTGRRAIGAVLGCWLAVAALLAAVVAAVVWDLRP